ncbi:MAG TPA: hypothetical protein VGO61_04245 [Steroidobacteraceae bacterium]|jgi:hypothetical protein|nr:hypothetical protein [Steroidobacteraceae bacterium]
MPRVLALVLLALVCAATGGCELLRMNPGRLQALTIAAQVGEFRNAHRRWPAVATDLDHSTLLTEFDEADIGEPVARKAARAKGLRVEMLPHGANLRLEMFDSTNRRVCSMELIAPTDDDPHRLMPVMVIKTTVISCPGTGKGFR